MKINALKFDEEPKLMIIPMIDIIFFLLVFFMMSMLSMVVQKNIPVVLPKAASAGVDTNKTIPITITREGAIYFEKEQLQLDSLEQKLRYEKSRYSDLSVVIRGEDTAYYGKIVQVMDSIKNSGVTKVSIATDSK